MHLAHAGVGGAVHRPAVDVVAEVSVLEHEDAHVTHGTEVDVLTHPVLEETLVDERVEHPLHHR